MASTGIIYRRDLKAQLVLNPPVPGEIVFSLDTEEYGAIVGTSLEWSKHLVKDTLFDATNYTGILSANSELNLDSILTIIDVHNHDLTYEPADATILKQSDILDNLTSASAINPLSANQGRILSGYIDALNTLLLSDDVSLDELQEIVDFIKANKDTLDTLGISNIAGLQVALDNKVDITTSPTLTLTGDISASTTFTNLGNASMLVDVIDDSHNHTTSTITDFVDSVGIELYNKLVPGANITTTFDAVTSETTISTSLSATTASELELITEGINTGRALLNRISANYGEIGQDAIDLSLSTTTSIIYGATGTSSLATGLHTVAAGAYSSSFGEGTTSQNSHSVSMGKFNVGTSVGTIVEVGIGSLGSTLNGLEVYVDGRILAPEQSIALHTDNRVLITKEYAESAFLAGLVAADIEAIVSHDNLQNINTNQHIDWTLSGAGTIDPSNYVANASTPTFTDFDATLGQTTFNVSYTVGAINVFVDGIMIRNIEYTATSGTDIVLNVGVDVGTWVQVIAY